MRTFSLLVALSTLGCGRVAFELGNDAAIDTVDAATCAAGFVSLPGAPHRYRFDTTRLVWSDAVATCAAFGSAYQLAVLESAAERNAIADQALALMEGRWWLGGTDVATEGVWLDMHGAPISYLEWAQGEPNDFGGEDCLDLIADPGEGVMRSRFHDDRACTATYPYVCACTLL